MPCIRGRKGYCICEEASETRWSQTISYCVALREILPPVFSIKLCRDPRVSNKLASTCSLFTVPDPDLEIGGGGGGEGGGRSPKEIFLALRASVWSKKRGSGHPGHSAGSTTGSYLVYVTLYKFRSFSSQSLALFFHAGLFH